MESEARAKLKSLLEGSNPAISDQAILERFLNIAPAAG
jgi:hypothetical protein